MLDHPGQFVLGACRQAQKSTAMPQGGSTSVRRPVGIKAPLLRICPGGRGEPGRKTGALSSECSTAAIELCARTADSAVRETKAVSDRAASRRRRHSVRARSTTHEVCCRDLVSTPVERPTVPCPGTASPDRPQLSAMARASDARRRCRWDSLAVVATRPARQSRQALHVRVPAFLQRIDARVLQVCAQYVLRVVLPALMHAGGRRLRRSSARTDRHDVRVRHEQPRRRKIHFHGVLRCARSRCRRPILS